MPKISWISATSPTNTSALYEFQRKMANYYATNDQYYEDINDGIHKWRDLSYLPFQRIILNAKKSKSILEVGCGRANILTAIPEIESHYHGIDFSPALINSNQSTYKTATFKSIQDPQRIPFEDNSFDFIYSTFVLEHVVFPHIFIDECLRVLKKDGILMIVCPDYLGHNWMASQEIGLSQGSGREKLKKNKFIDAALTFFDSKIRVPLHCISLKLSSRNKHPFFINIQPTCFHYVFKPDVDAVYVTDEMEIKQYTQGRITWIANTPAVTTFKNKNRLIVLEGVKA